MKNKKAASSKLVNAAKNILPCAHAEIEDMKAYLISDKRMKALREAVKETAATNAALKKRLQDLAEEIAQLDTDFADADAAGFEMCVANINEELMAIARELE